jgi:hypothetical protein
VAWRRFPAEFVEPLHLLVGAVGNETGSEQLAERGVIAAPADARHFDDGAVLARYVGLALQEFPARIRPVEDHSRHAVRVFGRVRDTRRRPLRNAEQRHRLAGPRRLDDRREIVGPLLDRQRT